MIKFLKVISILSMTLLLQSCAGSITNALFPTPIYHATGKTADLTVDVPPQYESSVSVSAYPNGRNFIAKYNIADSGRSIVYGNDGSQALFENPVKISANKKMTYRIFYSLTANEYCKTFPSFSLEAGKSYRLTVGASFDKSSFIHTFLLGRHDICKVGLAEIVGNKLIPVIMSKD
jgi:hypothetical protein